jgi:hypothetical protein
MVHPELHRQLFWIRLIQQHLVAVVKPVVLAARTLLIQAAQMLAVERVAEPERVETVELDLAVEMAHREQPEPV